MIRQRLTTCIAKSLMTLVLGALIGVVLYTQTYAIPKQVEARRSAPVIQAWEPPIDLLHDEFGEPRR